MQTLLGNLELARGRARRRARDAYRDALARVPGYVRRRRAALARVEAARGDLRRRDRAPARGVVARLPLPEYVIALGETELAAGPAAPRRGATSRWSAPSSGCSRPNGVNTDAELALFEADHGSPRARRRARAPRLGGGAERALRRRARLGADARRAAAREGLRWAHRALRLGSRDPLVPLPRRHGRAGRRRGRPRATLLARALARNPRFSPLLRAAGAARAGGAAMRRAA